MKTTIKTNILTPIQIGSKKYDVAITAVREWQSEDGSIARRYLTIGDPGIYEVTNAYVAVTRTTPKNVDVVVDTDAGSVVWTPIASGVSGAKRDAINAWFVSALKDVDERS